MADDKKERFVITQKDIVQSEMLTPEELEWLPREQRVWDIVENFVSYLKQCFSGFERTQDIELAINILKGNLAHHEAYTALSSGVFCTIGLLIMQGLDDDEIIKQAKVYFIKRISQSIPIFQMILRDTNELPESSITEDSRRPIELVKKICQSIIREFGTAKLNVPRKVMPDTTYGDFYYCLDRKCQFYRARQQLKDRLRCGKCGGPVEHEIEHHIL